MEHRVEAVALQGHSQIDYLGDALDGKTPLPVAAVEFLSTDIPDADPQLPAIRLAQLRDVACYIALSGVGFAKFQRLFQKSFIHYRTLPFVLMGGFIKTAQDRYSGPEFSGIRSRYFAHKSLCAKGPVCPYYITNFFL